MPTTRYARSGDATIAYQVAGEGALDLLFLPGWISQVEQLWELSAMRRFLERLAITAAAHDLGVEIRVGVHTGECELIGEDVGGTAVHIASRVSALAGPGEVLVSGTVFGTVVGGPFAFEDRGPHELKGTPGRWPLFALRG
ncbi:MAG: adenylate/guanylate cyclase domain-containing protein [Solirubrobacteraceae bacterium]